MARCGGPVLQVAAVVAICNTYNRNDPGTELLKGRFFRSEANRAGINSEIRDSSRPAFPSQFTNGRWNPDRPPFWQRCWDHRIPNFGDNRSRRKPLFKHCGDLHDATCRAHTCLRGPDHLLPLVTSGGCRLCRSECPNRELLDSVGRSLLCRCRAALCERIVAECRSRFSCRCGCGRRHFG